MEDKGADKGQSAHKLRESLTPLMHTQYVSVTGYLAGIAFTSMILLIQFSNRFLFSEWLITGTAIIGVFFILASLTRIHLITGEFKKIDAIVNITIFFTAVGVFGFIVIIPLMLWSITALGAIIVAVISGISVTIWLWLAQQ